jgi:hypothetical protein
MRAKSGGSLRVLPFRLDLRAEVSFSKAMDGLCSCIGKVDIFSWGIRAGLRFTLICYKSFRDG